MIINTSLLSLENQLLGSNTGANDIGVRFRQSKPGPEEELVKLFLTRFHIKIPTGFRVTLFKEPRLESGFPDLVAVIWHVPTTERWNDFRLMLANADLRVMHFIAQARSIKRRELQKLYGSRVTDVLSKLEAAEMIKIRGQTVIARPLSRLYATKHIIAIEAKITEWRGALDQAFLNQWFASASYVLLPRIPTGNILMAQADSLGVGIWSAEDTFLDARSLPSRQLPISYASWLFNEWAWRAFTSPVFDHQEQ